MLNSVRLSVYLSSEILECLSSALHSKARGGELTGTQQPGELDLSQFAQFLPSSCWQQGVQGGDSLLYFQMQVALAEFPSLQRWVRGADVDLSGKAQGGVLAAQAPPPTLIQWRNAAVCNVMQAAADGYLPLLAPPLVSLQAPSPAAGSDCPTAAWHTTDGFDSRPRFGFAGASWMVMYHIGAASALQERWALSSPGVRLAGTSSGSMLAMGVGAGVPLSTLLQRALQQAKVCEQRVMGPLGVMSQVSLGGAEQFLPPDAAARLSGRLRVTVTRALPCQACTMPACCPGPHHGHVTHWTSTQELLDTCLASSHIPGYFERPMVLQSRHVHTNAVSDTEAMETISTQTSVCTDCSALGEHQVLCWDGGLSENVPRWGTSERGELHTGVLQSDAYTATVSPEAQAGTISPPPAPPLYAESGILPDPPSTPFDVEPSLGAGGWPKWYSLVPPKGEQYWQVFFAGRGHAQAWMRKNGFLPRGRPAQ